MNNRKKNAIYSLILILVVVAVWWIRDNKLGGEEKYKVEFSGPTQGTTYTIKYLNDNGANYQEQVDSLLGAFDMSLSTYVPASEISQFNKITTWRYTSPYFFPVLQKSKDIYDATSGAFDPTIYPLANAWGFGPEKVETMNPDDIDSLLLLVNFDSIYFDEQAVCKMMPGMKLDFNAIAQGYSVDIIVEFLKSKGIKNMMVEIGGEVYCAGVNENGEVWMIGIDDPTTTTENRDARVAVRLENRAIATSGNYRKTREINGKKYAHTISPVTGMPVEHSLLSASVFAADGITADGYATAFMVMGLEESIKLVESRKELDAFFVFRGDDGSLKTYITKGIAPYIVNLQK